MAVALELIAEGGITALTMRRIAEQIGISEPAIYRHFASKENILEAILLEFLTARRQELQEIEKSSLPGLKKLEQIFQNRLKNFADKPDLAALIFREDILDAAPGCRRIVLELMDLHRHYAGLFLKASTQEGHIRADIDLAQIAFIFLASLRSLVQKWHLQKRGFALQARGKKILRALLQMISSAPVRTHLMGNKKITHHMGNREDSTFPHQRPGERGVPVHGDRSATPK